MKTSDGTKLPRILQAWTCLELSDLKRGESDILQKVTVKLIKHRVSKYALEAVSSSGGSGVQPEFSWRRVIKWTCQWLTGPLRPLGLALSLPAHKGIKAQSASTTPHPSSPHPHLHFQNLPHRHILGPP